MRGIKDGDIWGPTDVYTVAIPLPGDSKPLVLGQVLTGMNPTDKPLEGPKNDPMMPVAWVKTYKGESGKTGRVFTTTMGASQDLSEPGAPPDAGQRQLLGRRPRGRDPRPRATWRIVGDYKPTPFGFGKAKKGVKPAELARD